MGLNSYQRIERKGALQCTCCSFVGDEAKALPLRFVLIFVETSIENGDKTNNVVSSPPDEEITIIVYNFLLARGTALLAGGNVRPSAGGVHLLEPSLSQCASTWNIEAEARGRAQAHRTIQTNTYEKSSLGAKLKTYLQPRLRQLIGCCGGDSRGALLEDTASFDAFHE